MGSGAPVAILAYLKEKVGLICNLFMLFFSVSDLSFFRFLAFVLSMILVLFRTLQRYTLAAIASCCQGART